MRGWGVAGSQPMSTAVHRSPNKLHFNLFNLDRDEELGKFLKISRISAGNTYRKHVNIIILKEGGGGQV
jgi:hypothetical protein